MRSSYDSSTLDYVINHVFLPPKLPQQNDQDAEHDQSMLDLIIEALSSYHAVVSDHEKTIIRSLQRVFNHARSVLATSQPNGGIQEDKLREKLALFDKEETALPLHIQAQNAGLIINKVGDRVLIETFELSPCNEAVMTTQGRLRRLFPGFAVTIDVKTFLQPEFQHTLVRTLVKMSHQPAPGMKPRVQKAKQMHEEDRDTVHPKVVTELLAGFLRATGTIEPTLQIWKNTREEVLWSDCLAPWRRSPLWLLIRVTLQLLIARSTGGPSANQHLYKRFMIFFMSKLLDKACENLLPPDTLHIMNAKIARRVLKLRMDANTVEFKHVKCAVERSACVLNSSWNSIVEKTTSQDHQSKLRGLDFEGDLKHSLPELDRYVTSMTSWPIHASTGNFEPPQTLMNYHSSEFPCTLDASLHNLVAFEEWVASNLSHWLQDHGKTPGTCGSIRNLLSNYHTVARPVYSGDPEATSRMVLIILELWIACDTSARQLCSLLDDYDPGLPFELLQCLLVPTRSMVERLNHVEQYLLNRQQHARFTSGSVFVDFGKPNCFAVRYFDNSPGHQELLSKISQQAKEERLQKIAKYKEKRAKYQQLMRSYDETSCEYEVDIDGLQQKHRPSCQRCRYRDQAAALDIDIHEWPLPDNTMESQNVAFELMVPAFFGHWREACFFVVHHVFQSRYQAQRAPAAQHTLKTFHGLRRSFRSFDHNQTIGLLSEVKPHSVTHRRSKQIGHASLEDICLNNGLRYRYFDNRQKAFVDHLETTDAMRRACTYTLPALSAGLEMYLARSPERPNGPDPNTVVACQADCPQNLSLLEFKALASLPLGFRVVWMNILRQLFMPVIDFKKEETALIILQCANQAGPASGGDPWRATHDRLSERSFGSVLLEGLNLAIHRIQKNWESLHALGTLIALAARLLALTLDENIVGACLSFLASARTIARGWLSTLQDKRAAEVDDSIREELHLKLTEAALTCAQTFALDEQHARTVLQLDSNISTFIECSIIIHNNEHVLSEVGNSTTKRSYRLWKEVSWRVHAIVTRRIVEEKSSCLDDVLIRLWQAYEPRGHWRRCSGARDHWLITEQPHSTDGEHFTLHFDSLSGALLINSLPLGRLPAKYERHPMYRTLFGHAVMEVMPSQRCGMQFSVKDPYAGHILDLGMHNATLRVHAVAHGQAYVLIPRGVLHGEFPDTLVREHVHWYNKTEDVVEFRPVSSPWTSTKACWRLSRSDGAWLLLRDDVALINVNSTSALTLSSVVAVLESREHMHITYKLSTRFLELDLPRRQLGFFLTSTKDFIRSRQFRDHYIDCDQSLGTLVGLQDRLMLRHGSGARTLVLPQGDVSVRRHERHVHVSVNKGSMHKFHAYRIDPILGRLIDNGDLQSKLWLCYMHALTSFCLPDPLTGRTGTEQALEILQSSAVASYDVLSHEDIELLARIARLTPGRQYYPAHECVMQQIKWDENISALSQHGRFYRCVTSIFESVRRAALLFPGETVELPRLDHVNPILLDRDDIRSSCWRTAEIAEAVTHAYTTAHDVTYASRDQEQQSTMAQNAFVTSRRTCTSSTSIHYPPRPDDVEGLWNFLAQGEAISGGQKTRPIERLEYDAAWLVGPEAYLRRHWCDLHRHLHEFHSHKFDIAMWLSTIAFSGKVTMSIIQIVMLFFTDHRVRQCYPPVRDSFQLSQGYTLDASGVFRAIRRNLKLLSDSPEHHLARLPDETARFFDARQQRQFKSSREQAVEDFFAAMKGLWPCRVPYVQDHALYDSYIDVKMALQEIKPLFEAWHDNHSFRCYIQQTVQLISLKRVETADLTFNPMFKREPSGARNTPYIDTSSLFATVSAPSVNEISPQIRSSVLLQETQHSGERLAQLIDLAVNSSHTRFEEKYMRDLKDSLWHLQTQRRDTYRLKSIDRDVFQTYHEECANYVRAIYDSIHQCLTSFHDSSAVAIVAAQFPRVTPILLLQQLRQQYWTSLSAAWRSAIVEYAKALTLLQKAGRCRLLLESPTELCKEVMNSGHNGWDPIEHSESLLMEVEHDLLIRPNQAQVASEMRKPSTTHNTMMQLNMGEGKSSVIVPMVAASLADGSRLVRIIVTKPQSKQMFHTLVTKLGGLLARRVYRLPFSRDLKPDERMATVIREICEECMIRGGVLLLQPEHVLSMHLAGLDQLISGECAAGQSLLSLQEFFQVTSRDIVDESDENFSVKFELVYTMGVQRSVEMGSARWFVIQQVLDLVRHFASLTAKKKPDLIEIGSEAQGVFPRIRVLRDEAWRVISSDIVAQICAVGLAGFPVARLPAPVRQAIVSYILERDPSRHNVAVVEDTKQDLLGLNTCRTTLLLLRGLFAGGVLLFVFKQKRWRVHYGLTASRTPSTQLAVPYRAKDHPTARAEFSHPDVVIMFTCLSHYYSGLSDDNMFLTFSHLLKSDQADLEYQEWVKSCPSLSAAGFRHVTSINLRDRTQCIQELYPVLRRTKRVIDYFVAQVVFPKQLKSFPHKLSSSGWDIGQIKTHPTTGFSGTNDSRTLLPVDVSYLDVPNQKYTNAIVLEYLLQPENSVLLMPSTASMSADNSATLLSMIVKQEPPVRVVLDVGAQILELSNIEVAREWLRLTASHSQTEAVVFFGDDDELNVIDRNDKIESLRTSFFAEQLDLCLVFLDEAHTRGTDLRLPSDYRAVVTLGGNVTKDKLAQACMRMRKLGHGQSIVFCVPHDIQTAILLQSSVVDTPSILRWAITETCNDVQNSMSLWATQGQRFLRQHRLRQALKTAKRDDLTKRAEMFLEDESPSLEQRYRPKDNSQPFQIDTVSDDDDKDPRLAVIRARCSEFERLSDGSAALHEEQERELSPEIERERQVQRPGRADAAPHRLHPDLKRLVLSGKLAPKSSAWQPAFRSLKSTSAASLLDLSQLPTDMLVTADFTRTVQGARSENVLDDYQRPVEWLLTFGSVDGNENEIGGLMIISPYEAHEILPMVAQSDKVTLRLYAPRTSLGSRPLDDLNLYCVGKQSPGQVLSQKLKISLNLFAGQVYFDSVDEYRQVCDFLRLAWSKTADGDVVSADGFILSSSSRKKLSRIKKSPIAFLRLLMASIRNHGEAIDKTHMGVLLNGGLLQEDDFSTGAGGVASQSS